jgi:alpha-galactosidase
MRDGFNTTVSMPGFRPLTFICALVAVVGSAWAKSPEFVFDRSDNIWSLSNDVANAQFEITPDHHFHLTTFSLLNQPNTWNTDSPRFSTPIRFGFDGTYYGTDTQWNLMSQNVSCPSDLSCVQTIVLQDLAATVEVSLKLWMYTGQPVLRHSVTITNLKAGTGFVTFADMLPYSFADSSAMSYRILRVNQWGTAPLQEDFEVYQDTLVTDGTPVSVLTGAHGQQCAWVAMRDPWNRGIFAGWEFDGLATGTIQRFSEGYVEFSAKITELHHPLEPGQSFTVPSAFIGLFQGDWDEAGYRTQRFVESSLAKAPVDADRFPYVVWDSWAYKTNINEAVLMQEAKRASDLGVELFIVDLGWAKRLGDWQADPAKFPNGLKPLSDYVHSQGMKFGLHFAFAEADQNSAVIQENPDWTSSESDNYYGGLSLCLSNAPARDWIVNQAVTMIDNYGVDWILQDGENMVKRCTKTTHTHDSGDSNYSNAVDGVNSVIAAVQALRPNVMWENSENGGNMMTFNMVNFYVTSITNDASGALASRQAAYGATYPFPPRYADRYQPEDFTSTYITRSYMFGGPWHFMNQLATMQDDEIKLAQSEIQVYKRIRPFIRSGKVFHVTPAAQPDATDALQSYDPLSDSAITIVCKAGGSSADPIQLRGLDPMANYQVSFENDPNALIMTGAQIMVGGVNVNLPGAQAAEIVYVQPVNAPVNPAMPSGKVK